MTAASEEPHEVRRTAILVLGMHRSGTSAVTRVLSLLGTALPKTLMGAAPSNETGHWEPLRIVAVHDAMLAEAGSRWDDWRSFDPDLLGAERLPHYKEQIRTLLGEEFGEASVFVIKDPRICRFAPLYEEVLAELDTDVRYVIPYRNPLAVIASLAKRDRMTIGFAAMLWLRHILDAEAATRSKPRALISYEALLADWRTVTERMGTALAIEWPRSISEAATEVETHISSDLEHHAAAPTELEQAPGIERWVKETYGALLELERDPRSDSATATLDRIRSEFEPAARIFGRAALPELFARGDRASARIAAARERIAATSRQLQARTKEAHELSERLKEQDQRIVALGAERDEAAAALAERESAVARLEARLSRRDEKLRHLNRELKKAARQITTGDEIQSAARMVEAERDALAAKAEQLAATEAALEARLKAAEQRAADLDAELAAFRRSRLGRLRSNMDAVRNLLHRIRLHGGTDVGLTAAHDLELTGLGRLSKWKILGSDPQFELSWFPHLPLPSGHYRLWLEMPRGWEQLASPRIYVDSGEDYSEAESIILRGQTSRSGHPRATFSLVRGARRLRFDPADAPGILELGRVRLRKLTRPEYYARLTLRAMRRRKKIGATPGAIARAGLAVFREGGLRAVASRLRTLDDPASVNGEADYGRWMERFDSLDDATLADLRCRTQAIAGSPLISVVMPVYNTPADLLRETIESVRAQAYENWELCIADDCSTKPHVREILASYAREDHRIKIVYREQNGHISHATNSAFELASGDWIALLDHDDLLRRNALAEVALEIERRPDAELIYSDEDKIGPDGKRYDPYFKPDYSRELFRSQNYFNHLTVHRAANIRAVGGWRPGFEGSQDYDLNLRIIERIDPARIRHIPKVLYHWRAVEGSTAVAGSEKSYAYTAGMRALQEHVERLGLPAKVEPAPETPFYRVRFAVPDPQPKVSLVIPTRDRVDILRNCVSSIREKTTYRNYEILVVDNGSTEPETLAYFEDIKKDPAIRVLPYDKPFNYSAINNYAVKKTRGQIIGLVNNDIEVIAPDWLEEMVSWAARPDIGCVGAKLYYPNDTIQHAGVILGIGGVAGHSHKYFPRAHPGYFSRLKILQNVSAVTAACLLVRKEVYWQVGGLDEKGLTVAFNDVDFCLKVREAGYSNVFTPYAELYHHESISRGTEDNPQKAMRFRSEIAVMSSRWGAKLRCDPFYSPCLSLQREDFSLCN